MIFVIFWLVLPVSWVAGGFGKDFWQFNYCAVCTPNSTIYLNQIPAYNLTTGIPCEAFCAWQCRKDPRCLHFNFKKDVRRCEFFNTDVMSFEQDDNCIHFQNRESVLLPSSNVNLALGRPATQSSTVNGCGASRSVDGNRNTNIYGGSCTNTNDGAGGANWWMVDLGQPYRLNNVVMYNRNDFCGPREDYFIVGATNVSSPITRGQYPLCGQYCSTARWGGILVVYCKRDTIARYVIIQQPSNGIGYLNFCELEVYSVA